MRSAVSGYLQEQRYFSQVSLVPVFSETENLALHHAAYVIKSFILSQDWAFQTEEDWEPCPEFPGQCERNSRTFWKKMIITRIYENALLARFEKK